VPPSKKPKPHEPSLDARSLFCMRDFADDVIWKKKFVKSISQKKIREKIKFAEPEIPSNCCITHIDCG